MMITGTKSQDLSGAEAGFTLLELLLAITILTVGMLAVGIMELSSAQQNAAAYRITESATLASDRLEKLMRLPYDHADLAAGDMAPSQDADAVDNNLDGVIDEAGETGNIAIAWNVSEDSPIENSKTVTVTVTRTHRGGARQLSMQCIVSLGI